MIAVHLYVRQRDLMCNFFQHFQNVLDFKLAWFFYSAHVLKARIDESFKDGFLVGKSDAQRLPLARIYCTRFWFHSAHGLYRKLDDMIIDAAWNNGFVNFQLGKGTEFWYWDFLHVWKYLLCRKSFAPHMSCTSVKNFNGRHERVYTEMNAASWWWHAQAWIIHSVCIS